MKDDNGKARKRVCLMLRRLGYEVTAAADGVEAIEFYRKAMEDGERYDAVILDLTVLHSRLRVAHDGNGPSLVGRAVWRNTFHAGSVSLGVRPTEYPDPNTGSIARP